MAGDRRFADVNHLTLKYPLGFFSEGVLIYFFRIILMEKLRLFIERNISEIFLLIDYSGEWSKITTSPVTGER